MKEAFFAAKLTTMQEAYVTLELADHVGVVEFYHPQSNSLPGAILSQLAETIEEAGQRPEVKIILLKSGGERAFCAGASFDELMAISNDEEGLQFFSGFAKVINAMRTSAKLIVGRVQGKTVGGGVGVASAMDYCFATKYASVKLSELAVGIGPFVVGPAVQRKVGLAGFSELAVNATEWKSAQWANERGLYSEVFDDAEGMDAGIQAFLDRVKSFNPEAMSEMKRILWEGTEHWDRLLIERAAVSGRLVLSEFTRNAINKFKS